MFLLPFYRWKLRHSQTKEEVVPATLSFAVPCPLLHCSVKVPVQHVGTARGLRRGLTKASQGDA